MTIKLNVHQIVVGDDGRVEINDQQLAKLEQSDAVSYSGGWGGMDGSMNDFMCDSSLGSDLFCISNNPTNCDGETNVYTACPNGNSCRSTTNLRDCVNPIECSGSTNFGCVPMNTSGRCGKNDACPS